MAHEGTTSDALARLEEMRREFELEMRQKPREVAIRLDKYNLQSSTNFKTMAALGIKERLEEKAVDLHKNTIDRHGLDCMYSRPGHTQENNDLLRMMKEHEGLFILSSTGVIISNSTKADLVKHCTTNYRGKPWKYPVPTRIGPGETEIFLHVDESFGPQGSKCSVIYEAKAQNNSTLFVLAGFESPNWQQWKDAHVHTDIRADKNWTEDSISRSISEGSASALKTFPETGEHKGKIVVTMTIGKSYKSTCHINIGDQPHVPTSTT